VPFLFAVIEGRSVGVDVTCKTPHSNSPLPMKIAVVGCGALGSYYGAKLCRDGQAVHFLLRSEYEIVRCKGVFIRSPVALVPSARRVPRPSA
jgi:hypothetical protein